MRHVPPQVWEALWLAGWAEDGKLPVEGGVLDQTQSILEAFNEIARIKSEITSNG